MSSGECLRDLGRGGDLSTTDATGGDCEAEPVGSIAGLLTREENKDWTSEGWAVAGFEVSGNVGGEG